MAGRTRRRDEPAFDLTTELILLCGAFLMGATVGSFFASGFSLKAGSFFSDYLTGLANGVGGLSFRAFMVYHGVLVLLIFLGAFAGIGSVVVPFAVAVKGFTLSAAITCYIKLFGIRGYLPAAVSFLASGFVVVAVLLLLACRALEYSRINGRKRIERSYFLSGGAACRMIARAGLLHCWVLNFLTAAVLSWIS